MSVNCEAYIGYAVTLKKDLTHDDFRFFNNFEEAHENYSQYDYKGKGNVRLIIDGMNGSCARLFFIDERIEECWIEGKSYFVLKSPPVPDNVYNELNEAYKLMYGKDLDRSSVEYALWFFFS